MNISKKGALKSNKESSSSLVKQKREEKAPKGLCNLYASERNTKAAGKCLP